MLARLDIHQVRNIKKARLVLDRRFNIIYGPNGSGKTSLLESLYVMSRGCSFRARELMALVTYDENALSVFGALHSGEEVSVQKAKTGTTVRLNQTKCQRASELARLMPCQVFYQDIFEIMDAGPQVRRGVLDWGLFYQASDYHVIWADYKQVLKQRNALLRQGCTRKQIAPWDTQLVELAHLLHEFRLEYTAQWFNVFQTILPKLSSIQCGLAYDKGWDKTESGISLEQILVAQFESDLARQYTQSGAHQADIGFDTAGHKAKQTLSRGQQKMILVALKLAQAHLLQGPCMYLFDDITAELDEQHVQNLLALLQDVEGQFFFTAIDPGVFLRHETVGQGCFFALDAGSVSRETPESAVI